MEALKKRRRLVRREFDEYHVELQTLLDVKDIDKERVEVLFRLFEQAFEKIRDFDEKIILKLMKVEVERDDEEEEHRETLTYKTKYETVRVRKEKLVPTEKRVQDGGMGSLSHLKLAPPEIAEFSGELKDWLGWWAQFQKVHEDPNLSGSDKFFWLVRALKKGTDAYQIVAAFPRSNENYELAIEALKKECGNKDHLLQVYIRELLNLVISNASSKEKIPMKTLYLLLNSYLTSLKTLGMEQTDPATWLLPLVEGALPENVQARWHQNSLSTQETSEESPLKNRLDCLMTFLEKQVAIKRRLDISRQFTQRQGTSKGTASYGREQQRKSEKPRVSTVSSLHTCDVKKCCFCDFSNHLSNDCYKGDRMNYQEKIDHLKRKGLCFRCGGKHLGRDCDTLGLECSLCDKGKHIEILCKKYISKRANGGQKGKRKREESSSSTYTSAANVECSGDVILQTLIIKLIAGIREEIIRAFIDQGSQRSYITKRVVRALGLVPINPTPERVRHGLFSAQFTKPLMHNIFEVAVMGLEGDEKVMFNLRDQEEICGLIPPMNSHPSILFEELRENGVKLAGLNNNTKRIDMLIGADLYSRIVKAKNVKLRCGAVATETLLGWTVLGEVVHPPARNTQALVNLSMGITDVSIPKLWELEALGIKDPVETKSSRELENVARAKFLKEILRLEDGRYSVRLPWKEECFSLGTNKDVAVGRLISNSRKLLEANLFEKYCEILRDWETEGFIEKVKPVARKESVHYLPHRGVIKESLTTPVRIVFDASSRTKGGSLNDCLYKGENLMTLIPDILYRFREKRVGFVSDIRKAFQMVAVDVKDRDLLRFLWWKDKDMKAMDEYRHARLPFGATCSPFILGAVLHQHLCNLPEEEKEIGKQLLAAMYVDNCVLSMPTYDEYLKFREKSTAILSRAQMDLRMWLSNVDEFENEETHIISVLGVMWDRKRDELFVKPIDHQLPEKITKRSVLRFVQKLFDPLGIISPVTMPIKKLLQNAWIAKLGWDVELPIQDAEFFTKWVIELEALDRIRLPRDMTMGSSERKNWCLHTFADASIKAIAAIVFLRIEHEEEVSVQIISAKSRISPMNVTEMPRLELLACFIAARLTASIVTALSLEDVEKVFWSDSTIAIAWIKREENWRVFVANRVKEIVKLVGREWKHIPGEFNPADLPSRGCSPSSLLQSRWWEGPDWLYREAQSWPKSKAIADEEKVSAERKREKATIMTMIILETVKSWQSYQSKVRIVGWVRRFLHNFLLKDKSKMRIGRLTWIEKERAEFILLREIQQEAFDEETLQHLKRNMEIVTDEWGLLRVRTRLIYGRLPESFKYPILLPSTSAEVKCLLSDMHRSYCHAGVNYLCSKIREKYWVLKGRRAVRSIVFNCHDCRRHSVKPVVPPPAPLPLDRIRKADVFDVVGVDLGGHLILKNGKKAWFVIFTCSIYRAVHLILIDSLSTAAFLKALKKFVKRFHRPTTIYSDNGTNFHGLNNWLSKLDWQAIQKADGVDRIRWKFSPSLAKWWGGKWERQIRTVKDMLKRTVGKASLNARELESILESIEDAMNARPLTHLSESPNDLEPLTPNHFLRPFGVTHFPEEELAESERLRFRFHHVKTLQKHLRKRFEKEYLGQLINARPQKPSRQPKVGELVYVGDDTKKRVNWPLGRILGFYPGQDGGNRLAQVRVKHGVIIKAVQHLYPLELDMEKADETEKTYGQSSRGRLLKHPDRLRL